MFGLCLRGSWGFWGGVVGKEGGDYLLWFGRGHRGGAIEPLLLCWSGDLVIQYLLRLCRNCITPCERFAPTIIAFLSSLETFLRLKPVFPAAAFED